MVRFKGTFNKCGQVYVPSEVRDEFKSNTVEMVANTTAMIMYPTYMPLEDVLRSLDIIQRDLAHRIDLQKKNNNGGKG